MNLKQSRTHFGIADLAIFMVALFWGLNFVITKSAAGNDPGQFKIFIYNALRFIAAAALLFFTIHLSGRPLKLPKGKLFPVALLAFFGSFMYQVLYMTGQTITSSANAGIVYGFGPLLIVLVSGIIKLEKFSVGNVSGVVLGTIGISLVIFERGDFIIDLGSLLVLAATFCWAIYSVFLKFFLKNVSSMTAMAWVLLFGGLYQLPLALYQLPSQSWSDIQGLHIFFLVLSGLFSLYVAHTLHYYAVSRMGPSRASIYLNLTPVFALIFSFLIRGEMIRFVQVGGLSLILGGIGLSKTITAEALRGHLYDKSGIDTAKSGTTK